MGVGEAWNSIMYECMVQPPDCSPGQGNCGNLISPPIYFISFVLIGSLVMLNLLVAVVLENFSISFMNNSDQASTLTSTKVALSALTLNPKP